MAPYAVDSRRPRFAPMRTTRSAWMSLCMQGIERGHASASLVPLGYPLQGESLVTTGEGRDGCPSRQGTRVG